MALTDADRALLDLAGRWYRYPGAFAQAVRDELGLTETGYWRRINDLLEQPAALAYAPGTVNRLRRLRAERLRARSAQGLVS